MGNFWTFQSVYYNLNLAEIDMLVLSLGTIDSNCATLCNYRLTILLPTPGSTIGYQGVLLVGFAVYYVIDHKVT